MASKTDLPLAGMNDHALLSAAGAGEVRRVAAGNLLYRTGEAAAECFLVVAGALELVRTTPVGPQRMGTASVADFAGEEALVGSERTADARASEPTTVLGFAPDFFFDDQMTHLSSAASAGAGASGHVDAGVVNVPTPTPAQAMLGAAAHSDEGTVNKLIRSRRTERA